MAVAPAVKIAVVLLAVTYSAHARRLLEDDAAGTVITGPHTETKNLIVASNGCQSYDTTPDRAAFNYTSTITYAALPSGCASSDITATKVFARGACAETRANNYAVKSLGISNKAGCAAVAGNDTATCTATFDAASPKSLVKGVTSGQQLDSGEVCWAAPFVYVFVRNACASPINVTVTNLFNDYRGSCTANDGDDADAATTASNSGGDNKAADKTNGGGGLSSGAKAGIGIGVVVGVALIAAAVYFLCCQLGKK